MKKVLDELSIIVSEKFEKVGFSREYGAVSRSNREDICQFQCNGAFAAAKQYRQPPFRISDLVAEELKKENIFESVESVKPGFINMKLKDSYIVEYLERMRNEDKLGCEDVGGGRTVVVDYGGANVAKPLHVGHLRSAIIGESIKRMYAFCGYNTIGDVHLGDWGLQIGMVISELKRRKPDLCYFDENFEGEYPHEAPFTIDELEEIYPTASKRAKSDPVAMEEAREATRELQKRRRGYIQIWNKINDVSTSDLKKNYGALNVEFDLWYGESTCQEEIEKVVGYLKEGGYTYTSEGALVVDVAKEEDKYKIPPFMVLKSDGAALYSTTDLATIWQRVHQFNPDKIVYVVDKRQKMHFEQVFRCAEISGIKKDKTQFSFIGFGTMNGKDGKPFKTRDGGVMRLQDLIKMIKDNALDKIDKDRFESGIECEETARKIGLAALKYGDLSNIATKDYVFDLDRFASFEGNTGPYIQYTVVRIKSIMKKCGEFLNNREMKLADPSSDVERDLMLKLTSFNDVVEKACEDESPYRICEYVYSVANGLNKFYNSSRIVSEEDENKKLSWLSLISLTAEVIEKGLELLGIEVPDRM